MTTATLTPTKAINFTAPNLRKSLDGLKWQTRRVVNLCEGETIGSADRWLVTTEKGRRIEARYKVGEIVALRTTWAVSKHWDNFKPSDFIADAFTRNDIWLESDGKKPEWAGKSRPAMFLPRTFWPLMPLAEITRVRVERLQEIRESDCIAEGIDKANVIVDVTCHGGRPIEITKDRYLWDGGPDEGFGSAEDAYAALWDSINHKKHPWSANPWVFAYDYKMVEGTK